MSIIKKINVFLTWTGSVLIAAVITLVATGLLVWAAIYYIAEIYPERMLQKQEEIQPELLTEFNSIPAPAHVTLVSYDPCADKDSLCRGGYTRNAVIIDASYSTNIQPLDIFNYYDKILHKNGWQFIDTGGTDWTHDWNNVAYLYASYCKGDYYAQLKYAGKNGASEYAPWTYMFSMSWKAGKTCQ